MALVAQPLIRRFSVYLVRLDPTFGVEMSKIRPCVVVSPERMHRFVQTVIIAPLTSESKEYPTRVISHFEGRLGTIALDQMRSVDRGRLHKRLGDLDLRDTKPLSKALLELFE